MSSCPRLPPVIAYQLGLHRRCRKLGRRISPALRRRACLRTPLLPRRAGCAATLPAMMVDTRSRRLRCRVASPGSLGRGEIAGMRHRTHRHSRAQSLVISARCRLITQLILGRTAGRTHRRRRTSCRVRQASQACSTASGSSTLRCHPDRLIHPHIHRIPTPDTSARPRALLQWV